MAVKKPRASAESTTPPAKRTRTRKPKDTAREPGERIPNSERITPGRRVTGRPTKYSELLDDIARDLIANEDYTIKDLARHFSVDLITIYNWRRKYESFAKAISEACDIRDEGVEARYLEVAMGTVEVTETSVEIGPKGETVKTITKTLAPSEPALRFWLTNRKSSKWKSNPGGTGGSDRDEAIKQWLAVAAPTPEAISSLFEEQEGES